MLFFGGVLGRFSPGVSRSETPQNQNRFSGFDSRKG
jgi:hypothetical protein